MEDECSPAVPLKTVLSLAESTSSWKYFIITGHIDDLNESGRAEKANKDRMTIHCNLARSEDSRRKGRDRSVESDRQSSLLSLNVLNG